MNRSVETTRHPFLLIPIETKAREFLGKVLLSCFAAEGGFRIILGEQNELQRRLKYLPRGIYIDKSIAPTKVRSFRKCKKLGNHVVAWCEEGISFRNRDAYLRERVSLDAFNEADLFFAWGSVQAEIVRSKVGTNNDKIVCTGNPRFDLLRAPFRKIFSMEADKIRSLYSPFILINTNFARYNHFYGRDFVIRTMKVQGRIKDKEDEAFLVRWADYLGEMLHCFVEMVEYLSRSFPEIKIIIRPHPSENQETWKKKTRTFPNVRVIREGNVVPWIVASEVMIQNSCTTGVEAFVLDEPAICYSPITSETYDAELPNAVSRRASTPNDVVSLVKQALDDTHGYKDRKEKANPGNALIAEYLTGIDGSTACSNIVSVLRELVDGNEFYQDQTSLPRVDHNWAKWEGKAIQAMSLARRIVRRRSSIKDYMRQKFPGLSLQEVQLAVGMFRETTDNFASVKVRAIPGTRSCFLISRDEN